ncbi:hypothetical protein BAE44_0013725, partial [Dichanthelium oligosanthes]
LPAASAAVPSRSSTSSTRRKSSATRQPSSSTRSKPPPRARALTLEVVETDHSGSSKRLRTKPEQSTDEASPRASDTESDALFDDAFLFGGQFVYFNTGAYESLDSLFSMDAMQSNAGVAVDRAWEKKKNAKGYIV